MTDSLTPYLDDLEERIDEQVEGELDASWHLFAAGKHQQDVFSPRRDSSRKPSLQWPVVLVNQALDDYQTMAMQQFRLCSDTLASGGGGLLCVRCNYGTPIMPSLWGAEIVRMEDHQDCLPCSRPLPAEAIESLPMLGVPEVTAGVGGHVFEMAERFLEIMAPYPLISRWVNLYHPDLQGPMDVCEMLWGSQMFFDLVDRPALVHEVLDVVTETYIAFMRRWQQIVPEREREFSVHWSMLHRGRLMLRDDSAMNLSPEMFAEFIRPYDQRLLDEFGGGAVHACGRLDHYIDQLAEMPGLSGVQLSQPHLNDMEKIYRHTVDRDVPLLNLHSKAVDAAIRADRPLRGQVHLG